MVTRGAQHVLTRPAHNSNPAPVAHGIMAQLSTACHPPASACPVSDRTKSPLTPEASSDKPLPSLSESQSEFTLDGIDFSPEPVDMSTSSPCTPQLQGQHADFSSSYAQDMIEMPLKEPKGSSVLSIESDAPLNTPTKDAKVSLGHIMSFVFSINQFSHHDHMHWNNIGNNYEWKTNLLFIYFGMTCMDMPAFMRSYVWTCINV